MGAGQTEGKTLIGESSQWGQVRPIAIIGIYRPAQGDIHVTQLIRGRDLNLLNLCTALKGIKTIFTFNGNKHDLVKIAQEFQGITFENIESVDLFEKAASVHFKAGLKLLEGQFGIERPSWQTARRHFAIKLWRQFEHRHCSRALTSLLEYNAQDTVNLYVLACRLVPLLKREAFIEQVCAAIE